MNDNGTISVAIDNFLNQSEISSLKPGKYVHVAFRDNGPGIDPRNINRIFDPYFTTKSHGNGLGLATTWSIIMKHNGIITVKNSNPGVCFDIYLPAMDDSQELNKPEKIPVQIKNLRILVMDDNEMIRNTAETMLTYKGHHVAVARRGEEAIEIYRKTMKSDERFDLVILDLTVIDGLGGLETLQKLLTMDSSVKAIVCSGYSNDPVMSEYKSHGFCGRLLKPFTYDEIDEVLQSHQCND
jgi:two-component system cell cycle sensor histidine kinase/response regulator CckA